MTEWRKEFATLIRATLQYLQEEWGAHPPLVIKEPPPRESKAADAPKPQPEPKPQVIKKEKPNLNRNWELNPMPLPTELTPEFTSLFRPLPLTIPIRIAFADPGQIFFLENVARALTKLIAPTSLYSGKLDHLLTNHHVLLVLAPLSLLEKRFPQVELHQLLKLDGPTLLPIADHYDPKLKRALWNILKSFRNTLPSSSM
ncbi:MAG: hypothetical protein JJU12_02635 [Chlamydiales bacterium]|nr:hypothetical protein [Chlamydiales bacterium]